MTVWKEKAIGVDVSSAQTGLDWSVISKHIDFAMIRIGSTDKSNATVAYDSQFATHIQGADDNHIPVGVYFVPDPELNGVLQVPLSGYKSGARAKDPEYSFIQKTLQNKTFQFIALVFANFSKDPVWNQANLEYLVNALQEGMKAGELPKVPIVLCANEDAVNKNFFFNKTNTFFDFVAGKESDMLRVWSLSNTGPSVTTTWEDVKNHLPLDTAKPTYLNSTKYQPLFWQFAVDKLPMNKQGGLVSFGMNLSTMTKEQLLAWMKFTPVVVPPVDVPCNPGFHKDTNGVCIVDTTPPVDHKCTSTQHWDEATQKCVDVPPVGNVDLTIVNQKLDKIQATLDRIFK